MLNTRHTRSFISSRPPCIIIISRSIVSIYYYASSDRFRKPCLRLRVRFYCPRFTTPRRRQLPLHNSINLTPEFRQNLPRVPTMSVYRL